MRSRLNRVLQGERSLAGPRRTALGYNRTRSDTQELLVPYLLPSFVPQSDQRICFDRSACGNRAGPSPVRFKLRPATAAVSSEPRFWAFQSASLAGAGVLRGKPIRAASSQTIASRSGSRNGSGLSSTTSTRLGIAVSPIPKRQGQHGNQGEASFFQQKAKGRSKFFQNISKLSSPSTNRKIQPCARNTLIPM